MCAPLGPLPPGVASMLTAFEQGSGICIGQMSLIMHAPVVTGIVLFTGWVLYGNFRQWAAEKEYEYIANGMIALSFMAFMSAVLLH